MHSTHLRKDREKKRSAEQRSRQKSTRKKEAIHEVKVEPRDPLLAYKKPELVTKLRAAYAERDQLKQQALHEGAELEQRYAALLQEHVQCGVTIAKLEAQLAQYLAFMERFRSSLRQEEYGQNE
jgi:type IV secretory pathway VirJ component